MGKLHWRIDIFTVPSERCVINQMSARQQFRRIDTGPDGVVLPLVTEAKRGKQ
jgi:hypothetical protein